MTTTAAVYFILCYLLGSIPCGLVITKLLGSGDIRKLGSGNIGATNVLRVSGKVPGLITVLLDMAKGFTPMVLGRYWLMSQSYTNIAILLCVIGHCYPVFLKFRGGKGVATSFACIMSVSPSLGLISFVVWLLVFWWRRLVSLSSILAVIAVDIASFVSFRNNVERLITILIISLIIIIRHKQNIIRIINGSELGI